MGIKHQEIGVMPKPDPLSRRERQIMDALFALGEASIPEVRKQIDEPPSENALRTLLQILKEKGHVKRRKRGRSYLFSPKVNRQHAGKRALQHVLETFYDGSIEDAVAAHFTGKQKAIDDETHARLRKLIDAARNSKPKGKKS